MLKYYTYEVSMLKYYTYEATCKVCVGVCHLNPVDQKGTVHCPVLALIPEESLNSARLSTMLGI